VQTFLLPPPLHEQLVAVPQLAPEPEAIVLVL